MSWAWKMSLEMLEHEGREISRGAPQVVPRNADQPFPEVEWSQDVVACDLDGDGRMELLYGNGDISNDFLQSNLVLTQDPVTFEFHVAQDYGLDFEYIGDLTEQILCRDLDADGQTDWLLVVNTDQPSWFYVGL